jgi:hypothetical protein
MPQLWPQGNSPTRHALLRDEVSKMRYTNDKVITEDFSRKYKCLEESDEKLYTIWVKAEATARLALNARGARYLS